MEKGILSSAFVCAAALSAQTTLVVPASHVTREGTASTNVPFGRSAGVRVQCLYDAALFAGPVTIRALAWRLDGGATAAGKQVDCEVRMSTLPGTVLALSATFAANRGADEVVVLPQQIVALPAHTGPAVPSPFLPPLPLATPFAYDPAQGSLVVEIVVASQVPGAFPLDATWVCDSPETAFGPPACAVAGGLPLRVESSTTQVIWGRPWVARVLDAGPGTLVTLALGTIESGPWNGFVLPQDLIGLGAPGCYVSIDVAASLFAIAAPDGSAPFAFVIPNTPAAVGIWLRFQGAAWNPAANALGVVTSQARKVQVCGFEPVGRVWAPNTGDVAGTREIGLAPVLQLTVQ
jgi:hypothetical protein